MSTYQAFLAALAAVGVAAAWWCRICDRKLLSKTTADMVQRGEARFVTTRAGSRLCVRYTVPPASDVAANPKRTCPVCIPNGLAATMASVGVIHDSLVKKGFSVLSYDRVGVGQSGPNPKHRPATVDECVGDMYDVMCSVAPPDQKWILLGPSMGQRCCAVLHGGAPVDGSWLPQHGRTPAPLLRRTAKIPPLRDRVLVGLVGQLRKHFPGPSCILLSHS